MNFPPKGSHCFSRSKIWMIPLIYLGETGAISIGGENGEIPNDSI